MNKVADKAYLPAMRELLDYYTAIRDGRTPELFEECPLCEVVESRRYPAGVSTTDCFKGGCPWLVYVGAGCWESRQVSDNGIHEGDNTPSVEEMRNDPTKRWLSTRIRQLTSWIEKTEAA